MILNIESISYKQNLDLPPTQYQWQIRVGFPAKNVIILVGTVIRRGVDSKYNYM